MHLYRPLPYTCASNTSLCLVGNFFIYSLPFIFILLFLRISFIPTTKRTLIPVCYACNVTLVSNYMPNIILLCKRVSSQNIVSILHVGSDCNANTNLNADCLLSIMEQHNQYHHHTRLTGEPQESHSRTTAESHLSHSRAATEPHLSQ
jgi:hypothetical protein